jgi:hypothetical protein
VSSKIFVSLDPEHKDRDNKMFWNEGNYLHTDMTLTDDENSRVSLVVTYSVLQVYYREAGLVSTQPCKAVLSIPTDESWSFNVSWSVRASSYIPIRRPTDATCDRFLFSIYMCITLHVSSVKRSSSGVPHRTYSLQFLCLCLSAALSCKKTRYSLLYETYGVIHI